MTVNRKQVGIVVRVVTRKPCRPKKYKFGYIITMFISAWVFGILFNIIESINYKYATCLPPNMTTAVTALLRRIAWHRSCAWQALPGAC